MREARVYLVAALTSVVAVATPLIGLLVMGLSPGWPSADRPLRSDGRLRVPQPGERARGRDEAQLAPGPRGARLLTALPRAAGGGPAREGRPSRRPRAGRPSRAGRRAQRRPASRPAPAPAPPAPAAVVPAVIPPAPVPSASSPQVMVTPPVPGAADDHRRWGKRKAKDAGTGGEKGRRVDGAPAPAVAAKPVLTPIVIAPAPAELPWVVAVPGRKQRQGAPGKHHSGGPKARGRGRKKD